MYVLVSGAVMIAGDGKLARLIEREGSASGPVTVITDAPDDGLTELQRAFCQAFVDNGGKSGEAAVTAGYGGGAEGMALRNLAKPKIQAEIARRVKMQTGSALAIALGGLLRIIEDSEDDRAVVAASLGLMDRFGMAPPKGPATQVNIGVMSSSAAQSILIDVQQRREQRLARLSDASDA